MRSSGLCSSLFAYIYLKVDDLSSEVILAKEDLGLFVFFITFCLSHLSWCAFYFLSFFEVILFRKVRSSVAILWFFLENYFSKFFLKILSKIVTNNCIQSFESYYGSLSWQERELSEMVGVFLLNKSDRRSAFLPVLYFFSPLLKTSPTSGYFDFILDTNTSILTACSRHS